MPIGDAALVYDENHSYYSQIPITQELQDIMGDELKKYVYGFVNKDKKLVIDQEAPEQYW